MLRQYNEYLKEQMLKEAQDEAQYDEIRQKAEARIWDQRDAQLKAQHDARATLMQQVWVGMSKPASLPAMIRTSYIPVLRIAVLPYVCCVCGFWGGFFIEMASVIRSVFCVGGKAHRSKLE